MQRTDTFCKYISKWLLNGKVPSIEVITFTHIKGVPYKHDMDSNQFFGTSDPKILAFSPNISLLVEAHDKFGHQGVNRTCHFIKQQYY